MNKLYILLIFSCVIYDVITQNTTTGSSRYYITTPYAIIVVPIGSIEDVLYLKNGEKGNILNFSFNFSHHYGSDCSPISPNQACYYLNIMHNTNDTLFKKKLIEEYNENKKYIDVYINIRQDDLNNATLTRLTELKKRNAELNNMILSLPDEINDTYYFNIDKFSMNNNLHFRIADAYVKRLLLNKDFYIEIFD